MGKLTIIYEDDFMLVLEKPAGLVVNKSETISEETLQDQLSDYFNLGEDLGIGERAGIVHRLDRETSGLMVIAKTHKAYEYLQAQFKERKIQKEYTALVHGIIRVDRGEIDAAIGRVGSFGKFGVVSGGREAKTAYQVEGRYEISEEIFHRILYPSNEVRSPDYDSSRYRSNNISMTKSRVNYLSNHAREYTLVTLMPKTGRTHQIRVHLKSIGHCVVSDLIYAPSKLLKFDLLWCKRLFLHAKSLEFIHPGTGKRIFFESSLPVDLTAALGQLTFNI